LASAAAPPQPQIDVYPGAHHGFDSAAPLRHWAEVPNGAQPGAGVHLGGQPAARTASREALLQFLRTALR
jgi:dienelactone hydrolase